MILEIIFPWSNKLLPLTINPSPHTIHPPHEGQIKGYIVSLCRGLLTWLDMIRKIFHTNRGLLTSLIQSYDGNTQGLSINKIKKQSHETTRSTQTLIETSCPRWKASHLGKHIDDCNKQALISIKPHSSWGLAYSPHTHIQNNILIDCLTNSISTWDLSGWIRVYDHKIYLDNSIIPIYNFIVQLSPQE